MDSFTVTEIKTEQRQFSCPQEVSEDVAVDSGKKEGYGYQTARVIYSKQLLMELSVETKDVVLMMQPKVRWLNHTCGWT